jgi:diadenylate cyclase
MLIGRLMNLVLLNWILQYIMAMLVVAIPIVFQPELRNALERLGRTRFIKDFGRGTQLNVVNEVLAAVDILSKQKIGALIVFQRKTGLREYIERGAELDAVVSAELLLSIFFPRSPLHDGAVIISGSKIVAASVTLPVSDFEASSKMGTRHRAGLGITENSDAVSVIVSEETGNVSLAADGAIERRIGSDRLENRLRSLLRSGK